MQYAGKPYMAYFTNNIPWYGNETNNIVVHMLNKKFDFILSGMGINGTWQTADSPKQMTDKALMMDFTCPYLNDGYGIVKGNLATSVAINSITDLNNAAINVCVQSGTAMETYAKTYLSNANITSYVNGNDPVTLTTNQNFCHCYLAPLINALYQAKVDNTKLTYMGTIGAANDVGIAVRKATMLPVPTPTDNASMVSLSALMMVLVALLNLIF